MTKPLLEHCPYCREDRNVKQIAEHKFEDTTDPEFSYYHKAHFFQCQSCRKYFLKVGHANENDVENETLPYGNFDVHLPFNYHFLPPQAFQNYPVWLNGLDSPKNYETYKFLKEIYKAFDHELYKFAAMGARALFEKTSHDLGISNSLPFFKILKELEGKSFITKDSKDALEVLVEGGHAAVHGKWSPSRDDLVVILEILAEFIYESVLKEEDNAIKKKQRSALKRRLPPNTRKKKT